MDLGLASHPLGRQQHLHPLIVATSWLQNAQKWASSGCLELNCSIVLEYHPVLSLLSPVLFAFRPSCSRSCSPLRATKNCSLESGGEYRYAGWVQVAEVGIGVPAHQQLSGFLSCLPPLHRRFLHDPDPSLLQPLLSTAPVGWLPAVTRGSPASLSSPHRATVSRAGEMLASSPGVPLPLLGSPRANA